MDSKTIDCDVDHDTMATKTFAATSLAKGTRTNSPSVALLNLNGRMEQFIASIKRKCLGKFILCGRRVVDPIFTEWIEYYNRRRSRMVRRHFPPGRKKPEQINPIDREQVAARY